MPRLARLPNGILFFGGIIHQLKGCIPRRGGVYDGLCEKKGKFKKCESLRSLLTVPLPGRKLTEDGMVEDAEISSLLKTAIEAFGRAIEGYQSETAEEEPVKGKQ